VRHEPLDQQAFDLRIHEARVREQEQRIIDLLGLIPHPDMEETLAWKEGLFHYNGAGITTIMNQLARWYGVEIIYQDKIPGSFVADIPRDVPVSKLLTLLELTKHVRFTIEGKKITVMK